MSTLRRAIAVVVLLAQALVPTPASAQEGFASTGGTVVSVDAPIVTITVTIDFLVPDPNREGMRETADGIAQRSWISGTTGSIGSRATACCSTSSS